MSLVHATLFLHNWLALGIAGVTAIYTWLTRRDDQSASRFTGIEARMEHVETRMTSIETRVEDLPGRADYHQLSLQIGDIAGQIAVLAERIKPLAATIDRVQDYLTAQTPVRRIARAKE